MDRLEALVGARLMNRTTRSLTLTAEGEAFLPYGQAMLEAAEEGAGGHVAGFR